MGYFALSDRAASQFRQLLEPTDKRSIDNPQGGREVRMHFVKLTEAATAAATDEVGKFEAQLYTWDANDNPGTLATNDLVTVNVWNPHNVEIPSGTLCIIGKFPQGWVIIAPVNWCPA